MELVIVAAVAANAVIGQGGGLPWHLPVEEKHYHDTIRGKWALVGRKSMSTEKNVLPVAGLYILTRDKSYDAGPNIVVHSIESAIHMAKEKELDQLIILGGSEVYRQTITLADRMILSHLDAEMEGESYFPEIDQTRWSAFDETTYPKSSENAVAFTVREWHRISGR